MAKRTLNDKKEIHLEYMGYIGICIPNPNDGLRYYGQIYSPDYPDEPMEDGRFAGDTPEEAKEIFEGKVKKIIECNEYNVKQKNWKGFTDWESIGAIFDILPDKFLERINTGRFDKSLLEGVDGGDYNVPLYYVTKAWDKLLKGSLYTWAFMIGPEEDDDFSEETLREFINEEHISRTRGQAIIDNDRVKAIWNEKFNIDIEKLDIDFTQFNMNIPPKVSHDVFYWHFLNVPDGVVEWVLCGINYPSGNCAFDSVSSLMEFAALIELEKQGKFYW